MTWGEFKALVDAAEGVSDDTEIMWIDTGACPDADDFEIELDFDGDLVVLAR